MQLDFSKPYAQVFGMFGAAFEQSGILFKEDGSPSIEAHAYVEETIPEATEEIIPPNPLGEEPIEEVKGDANKIEEMHWRHLKALVESYGGIWKNKEEAIAFLKGKA